MKIFNRNFWGTILVWVGVIIFLVVIYDIIRPVFPGHPPYPIIQSIQNFFSPSRGPNKPPPAAEKARERRPAVAKIPPKFAGDSRMLTANSYSPAGDYSQWVWAVKPDRQTEDTVRVEAAHAAPGIPGGFSIIAYADTTGDGMPDRKVAESELLTGDQTGQWSTFNFTAGKEPLFIGYSWAEGQDTVIFRDNGEWPEEDSPLEGRFFYLIDGPGSKSAGPAYTNLRVSFSRQSTDENP
jgi:hypothetical protein